MATPPLAMRQAAGAGGPIAGRDFSWPCSFLATGVAGRCAKTGAPLDQQTFYYQLTITITNIWECLLHCVLFPKGGIPWGLYKGNGAVMIQIVPYGAIQFTAFEHYRTLITTKLGVSGLCTDECLDRWQV